MKEEKDEIILINELENKRVIIEPLESDEINSQGFCYYLQRSRETGTINIGL